MTKWQNEFNGYTESKYECEKMHKNIEELMLILTIHILLNFNIVECRKKKHLIEKMIMQK